jgi:hypothetical protein
MKVVDAAALVAIRGAEYHRFDAGLAANAAVATFPRAVGKGAPVHRALPQRRFGASGQRRIGVPVEGDLKKSRALARLICTSEAAIDAYLRFGAEEAKALIMQHRAAVLAIAKALMVHRTLDAAMIDDIISRAPERARRTDWSKILENAAGFAAGRSLRKRP